MPVSYGDFRWLCAHVPSFATCNVLASQLVRFSPSQESLVLGNSTSSFQSSLRTASIGVSPECGVGRLGVASNLGGIADLVVSVISIPVIILLLAIIIRRQAAVGRIELAAFFGAYLVSLPFEILTTTGIFMQGSTTLTILTSVHLGLVVAWYGLLLATAIVSTQVVEDGSMASLVPITFFSVVLFIGTGYVALDTGFRFTDTLGYPSGPIANLQNITLFTLTLIIPAVLSLLFIVFTLYVCHVHLHERKPALMFLAVFIIAGVGSQVLFFLAGEPLCKASGGKVDGAFLQTTMKTAFMIGIFFCWRRITEEKWKDDEYYSCSV